MHSKTSLRPKVPELWQSKDEDGGMAWYVFIEKLEGTKKVRNFKFMAKNVDNQTKKVLCKRNIAL